VKVKQELLTEENVPDAGVSEMPAMGRHPVSALAISKIMQTSIPPQELVQYSKEIIRQRVYSKIRKTVRTQLMTWMCFWKQFSSPRNRLDWRRPGTKVRLMIISCLNTTKNKMISDSDRSAIYLNSV